MAHATSEDWRVGERSIKVPYPDKVLWPDDGLTRVDMLRYYEAVGPTMLPHFKDRPVTLRVFPDGIQGFSFYRRDTPKDAPEWQRSFAYQPRTTDSVIQLPVVDEEAGLIWLASEGALEFHLWASRVPRLSEPDEVIFDLDPGESATFADVLQAGLRLRDALHQDGLRCYPKTSGGRGLHVYMPLAAGHSFDAARDWVRGVAEGLASAFPDLVAVAHGATHHGEHVTIDHAQNSIGRNTAAAYTLRAHSGAPVSAPLSWDEVENGGFDPPDFNITTVPDRVRREGDLFTRVLGADQDLPIT